VAELDVAAAEVGGGFVAAALEAEGVVFFHGADGFGEEEFVVVFGGCEEFDAAEVDAEAVDGFEADGVVGGGVVVLFDPVGELAIEGVEGGQVEVFDEELIADAAEEAFDFSLGGGIANGGVAEDAADAGGDEGDFLGTVNGTVVDEELLNETAPRWAASLPS
jgi:hypothetical protein